VAKIAALDPIMQRCVLPLPRRYTPDEITQKVYVPLDSETEMQILQDFDLIRQGESVFFLKKGW
jgi:hypothetical protein